MLRAVATGGASSKVFNVSEKQPKKKAFLVWTHFLNDIRVKHTAPEAVFQIKTYLI